MPVSVFTAYCTTRFNAAAETARAQEAQAVQVAQEQKYIEDLKEAIRAEANQNAGNIERWLPGLVTIAKGLESFVNDRGSNRPGVNPGYGMLTETAFSEAVENPIATRYLPRCVLSALEGARGRLSEGNAVKRYVDAALAEYTATFPGPLTDAYIAAARLHAFIEQLVEIYSRMPSLLHLVPALLDLQDCSEEIVATPSAELG